MGKLLLMNLLSSSRFSEHMVLTIDGNLEVGTHVRRNLCYLICLRHLRSKAVKNQIFFHAYATCPELPSNTSENSRGVHSGGGGELENNIFCQGGGLSRKVRHIFHFSFSPNKSANERPESVFFFIGMRPSSSFRLNSCSRPC